MGRYSLPSKRKVPTQRGLHNIQLCIHEQEFPSSLYKWAGNSFSLKTHWYTSTQQRRAHDLFCSTLLFAKERDTGSQQQQAAPHVMHSRGRCRLDEQRATSFLPSSGGVGVGEEKVCGVWPTEINVGPKVSLAFDERP